MFTTIMFVIGLVVGAFFPNTIKPRVLKLWENIKNERGNSDGA